MSTEAEAQTQPLTTPSYSSGGSNIVKDVVLWREKKLSASVLIVATATWVLMEVYQFNFLTIISWLAMFVVTSIFLYANMFRLLGKETLNLSRLELTQETAERIGNTVRIWIEEAIRLLFRLSAEEDWPVFVGVVAVLWALSYVGSCMHFLTFLYIGIVGCMTVPITYVKNEDKFKRFVEWLKMKSKMVYEIIDEKAINKIKSRVVTQMNGKKKE
ncbi:hypothetical protein TanjilG_12957 [Lupinus angustifolius]|uniref:Reticulon-like protein n=1 Tax=Lupinus angustifolius TaxID=3871 RepID=A0A1J7GXD9_LUPAN|nr:PREDICTED: reticulon-like protein B13 isoform X1 [Lupinus angustifolius]OIV94744.1 hypothetical protein TanjilG_12957 [Lupinus angustifolius]